MLNSNVLVINRSYLPIHVTTVRRAFSLLYQGVARALDEDYQTFDFETWVATDAEAEETIGTSSGPMRVPRVIVLNSFDRVPKRQVRFSRVNIYARDKFTCQYCGIRHPRLGLNLDHVVPRALGGRSSWENVVSSCVDCNRRKGGRTPEQAGVRLRRRPVKPRWTPLVNLVVSNVRYKEWQPFLRIIANSSYGNTSVAE